MDLQIERSSKWMLGGGQAGVVRRPTGLALAQVFNYLAGKGLGAGFSGGLVARPNEVTIP